MFVPEWISGFYDIASNFVFLTSASILCTRRVSMGWWLLRLTANILAFLLLTVNFVPLRLTDVLKSNF